VDIIWAWTISATLFVEGALDNEGQWRKDVSKIIITNLGGLMDCAQCARRLYHQINHCWSKGYGFKNSLNCWYFLLRKISLIFKLLQWPMTIKFCTQIQKNFFLQVIALHNPEKWISFLLATFLNVWEHTVWNEIHKILPDLPEELHY
jgi:hypothetical protein